VTGWAGGGSGGLLNGFVTLWQTWSGAERNGAQRNVG